MTTVLKNIFFIELIALNWLGLLTTSATTKTRLSSHFMGNFVWQYFVTVKKYIIGSTGNGQLNTRTRVILLWATPVGLRPNRASPGITQFCGKTLASSWFYGYTQHSPAHNHFVVILYRTVLWIAYSWILAIRRTILHVRWTDGVGRSCESPAQ